ncbi:MAG: hypothetical protein FJX65_01580 [Alphaproteobacteria bacterium]|nr:hypothetical protein [Alphaproteobacteria bacterium]
MARRSRSLIIDADSHVEEAEECWAYLEPEFRHRRPVVLERKDVRPGKGPYVQDAFWLIDGHTFPRPYGHGALMFGTPVTSSFAKGKKFSRASQTLVPPAARVKDMDRLGIDIQILYPTIFLDTLALDIRFEAALMRSYNTWLAKTCAQFPNRLKWAAAIPVRSAAEGAAEIKRTKKLGAVAALIYGTAGERMLHEPECDEMWAAAQKADMAIAIHTGWNMQSLLNKMDSFYCSTALGVMPSMMGLFSMLGGGILGRFPKLRVGFFEAGADWLPYMINRMERLWEVYSRNKWPGLTKHRPSDWLRGGNVYFCCEGDERFLPVVAELLGDDHIITSADLPHDEALDEAIKKIHERPDLSDRLKSKILNANPARFYGL